MPRTAIVILNWNGKHFLEQFLPSVIKYSPADLADIVIADNASTDESHKWMKEKHPAIKWIQFEKNYGFAEGYNKALKQLPGYSFFILLNSDMEVSAGWIEPLINLMERDKQVAACMPKIRSFRTQEMFEYAGAAGGYIDKLGYPFCRGRIFDCIEKDSGQYDKPTDIFWATGACMMVRSELFFKAGGFDPDFFAHQEEIDLCWRLHNTGSRICYVPESVVFHVGGGTLSKDNPHKTYLNFRNNLMLLYKNLPRESVQKIIFIRKILDGISAIRYLLRGDKENCMAIYQAHRAFLNWQKKVRSAGIELQRPPARLKHPEIYKGSIVWDFFIRKKKYFSDIPFSKL